MPENIPWGTGFWFGIQMTFVLLVVIGAYTIKVYRSRVNTSDWYKANLFPIGIILTFMWVLSFGMVIVPNIANLLGEVGFNADKSPAGIAAIITLYFLKNTVEVAKENPGSIDRSVK